MQYVKSILLIFILSVGLISCNDDDPIIPNEEELITTIIYTLTPVGVEGDDVVFSFKDLDGDGGTDPVIEEGVLAANTTYTGTIEFLNELETPVEDITEEVIEEGDEHQVFYIKAGTYNATFDYDENDEDDLDINGHPIGIKTIVVTGAASTGTLTITLRHEPKKPNNGTLADAGGETDVQVTFNIVIQ